jgi:hypothetical protein
MAVDLPVFFNRADAFRYIVMFLLFNQLQGLGPSYSFVKMLAVGYERSHGLLLGIAIT